MLFHKCVDKSSKMKFSNSLTLQFSGLILIFNLCLVSAQGTPNKTQVNNASKQSTTVVATEGAAIVVSNKIRSNAVENDSNLKAGTVPAIQSKETTQLAASSTKPSIHPQEKISENTSIIIQPPKVTVSSLHETSNGTVNRQPSIVESTTFIASTTKTNTAKSRNVSSESENSADPRTNSEEENPKRNHNVSPRKGVPDNPEKPGVVEKTDSSAANLTTSAINIIIVKEKPRKPEITRASDDAPYPASNFSPKGKSNALKKNDVDIPSIESYDEKNSHKSVDYVVPIVAVILSVPLVAVLISVLYKRGSEWWHHRHYRRMDFLIEGMYNN